MKKGFATWALVLIIVGILLLLFIGIGFLGWWYIKNNTKLYTNPTPSSAISVAKTSTPNSQSSTANSNDSTPAASTATPTANSNNSGSSSQSSDSAALFSLCQAENPGMSCSVEKIDGNYAMGSASSTGGGANWYAKKVGGKWTMVVKGTQNDPPCSKVSDFPKTIAPTCM